MRIFDWLIKEYSEVNQHIFSGSDKETMSGRMGRKIASGKAGCCLWRGLVCAVLSLIDFRTWEDGSNHCIKSNKKENNAAK